MPTSQRKKARLGGLPDLSRFTARKQAAQDNTSYEAEVLIFKPPARIRAVSTDVVIRS